MKNRNFVRIGWGSLLLVALASALLAGWAVNSPSEASPTGEPAATFTLPAPTGPWTLIAYGDMRFTDQSNTEATNPVARRALVARVAKEKPDVLLLSGDVPYHGGNADDYAVYQQETAAWRAEGLKVFPAMGNHELYGDGGLENWWTAFPQVRGHRWYSVQFGEAYLITLDSNLDLTAGHLQSQWLAKQLDTLPPATRYVFISLHHPPVADPIHGDSSHNERPNEHALALQLEAAAPRLNAKIIVVAGHIHAYERFERNGIVYLVSGGGGAKQYPDGIDRSPGDLYQDDVYPNYHYIKFASQDGALQATMYRLDNNGAFVPSDHFVVGTAAKAAAK